MPEEENKTKLPPLPPRPADNEADLDPAAEEERRRGSSTPLPPPPPAPAEAEKPSMFRPTEDAPQLYGMAQKLVDNGISPDDITLFTGPDGKPSIMVSGEGNVLLQKLQKDGIVEGFSPMEKEAAKMAKEQGRSFSEVMPQREAAKPDIEAPPPTPNPEVSANEVAADDDKKRSATPVPPKPAFEVVSDEELAAQRAAKEGAPPPQPEAESNPKTRSELLREERGKAYQELFGAGDGKDEEKEGSFSFGKAAKTVVNVALAPVTLPAAAVAGVAVMAAQAANTAMNGVFSAAAYVEYGASAVVGLGGSAISGLSNLAKLATSTAEMATAWASEKLKDADFPGSGVLKAAVGAADYAAWGANKVASAGVATGEGISWAAEKGKEDARQTWERNENSTKNLADARQATIDAQKGIPDAVGRIGSMIGGIAGMFSGKDKEQAVDTAAEKNNAQTVAANNVAASTEPDKTKVADKSVDAPKPEAGQEQGEEGRSFGQRMRDFLSTPTGRIVGGVAMVGAAIAGVGFLGPVGAVMVGVGMAMTADGAIEAGTGSNIKGLVTNAIQEVKEQRAEARGEVAQAQANEVARANQKGEQVQNFLAGDERPLTGREARDLDREQSQKNPVFASILQGNDATTSLAGAGAGDGGRATSGVTVVATAGVADASVVNAPKNLAI